MSPSGRLALLALVCCIAACAGSEGAPAATDAVVRHGARTDTLAAYDPAAAAAKAAADTSAGQDGTAPDERFHLSSNVTSSERMARPSSSRSTTRPT
jgi:hypothetical protein